MSESLIPERSLPFRYELIEGSLSPSIRGPLWGLHSSIFTNQTPDSFWPEVDGQAQRQLLTVLAWADDQLVGYKMGYARKPDHFYSWLGCVHAGFRRGGIASELMRRQHDWCRQHNFRTIRTHTRNQWRDMLILNLRHDFDIIGTFLNDAGTVNIILEKNLIEPQRR